MPHSYGVAFEVPGEAAQWLVDLRSRIGDLSAQGMPPHVTLLPPTRVPAGRLVDVVLHLNGVAAATSRFHVQLSGGATFRPVTPTVYVPLVEGAQEATALAAAVRSGPLQRDLTFPYHPHVTAALELPDSLLDAVMAELVGFAAGFEVDSFTLYEADADDQWQPAQRFPLAR